MEGMLVGQETHTDSCMLLSDLSLTQISTDGNTHKISINILIF